VREGQAEQVHVIGHMVEGTGSSTLLEFAQTSSDDLREGVSSSLYCTIWEFYG
jgi:hypothetical protein